MDELLELVNEFVNQWDTAKFRDPQFIQIATRLRNKRDELLGKPVCHHPYEEIVIYPHRGFISYDEYDVIGMCRSCEYKIKLDEILNRDLDKFIENVQICWRMKQVEHCTHQYRKDDSYIGKGSLMNIEDKYVCCLCGHTKFEKTLHINPDYS